MIRQMLIFLRQQYNSNATQFTMIAGIVLVMTGAISLLVDAVVPFDGWWNVLRTAILIPLSLSMYGLGYFVGLFQHYRKMEEGDWTPFRLRFSVSWRRRIAIVVGAFLFVLIYGNSYRIGYTLIASMIVACIIALLAFVRVTKDENVREQLNIPDSRDVAYNVKRAEWEQARRDRREEKADKRRKVIRKNLLGEKEEVDE